MILREVIAVYCDRVNLNLGDQTMGAETFMIAGKGKTADLAFKTVYDDACYDLGHSGYTGSIAEKSEFVMIDLPDGADPEDYAQDLIDNDDPRIDDKWGPAGCIALGNGAFLFFGWASS